VEVPKGANDASVTGKIPVLETDQGCIFSSTAIARYVSRINRLAALYGNNVLEGGMIDSWIEFSTHELEVPLCTWVLPVMGKCPEVPEATACAKEDVKKALNVLNSHLLHNTYIVGHHITLADITLCCALLDGMKLVLDTKFRAPYQNVMRWFELCLAQPEFAAVLGKMELCGASASKAGAPKKDAAPKKEAANGAAPKKEASPKKDAAAKKQASPKAEPKAEAKKDGKKKDKKAKEEKVDEPVKKTPEELAAERKATLKKVMKEGGKRGVEIEGAADMGGLQFFCTSVDEPEGDIDLLVESVSAMNAESDPTEEERKGGSGKIGKMVFSAGTTQLAIVAYVPKDKQGELKCEEWLQKVVSQQPGGKVTQKAKDVCAGFIPANADKGIFPLKIREPLILEANNFLRAKGLFPEDMGDSDDEFVFGDDDFPS
jgi:glutathione S-transferase